MLPAISHAIEVRERLRNPTNAVRDDGIDLKRKTIPIMQMEHVSEVIVNFRSPDDVFGPVIPTDDDIAFGPVVCRTAPAIAPQRPPIDPFSIRAIQRRVCQHYGITVAEMLSARRSHDVVLPRHVAMFITKTITPRSYPYISRHFGGRDHTTAMNACRRIKEKIESDPTFATEIAELIAVFPVYES